MIWNITFIFSITGMKLTFDAISTFVKRVKNVVLPHYLRPTLCRDIYTDEKQFVNISPNKWNTALNIYTLTIRISTNVMSCEKEHNDFKDLQFKIHSQSEAQLPCYSSSLKPIFHFAINTWVCTIVCIGDGRALGRCFTHDNTNKTANWRREFQEDVRRFVAFSPLATAQQLRAARFFPCSSGN